MSRLHRYLLPYFLLKKRLGSVNLLVTRRCNMHCPYCGTVEKGDRAELTIEQWSRVIRMLSRTHFLFAVTGGEPLLYDGVEEIVECASRHGLVDLQTNGSLLTRERLDRFRGLYRISISLDDVNDYGSLDPVISERLKMARDIGRRKGFFVSVNSVVTRRNVGRIPDLARRLSSMGIELEVLLYHDGPEGNVARKDVRELSFSTPGDVSSLRDMSIELISMKRRGYLVASLDSYLKDMVGYVESGAGIRCRAGRDYLAVDTDGRLMACMDTPPTQTNALDIGHVGEVEGRLVASILPDCNCCWDCIHFYQVLKTRPWEVLGNRLRLAWNKTGLIRGGQTR